MSERDSVLIIEDDAVLLRGLSDNFRSRGWLVKTASDGSAGLDAALNDDPDLIILDLMLPEVNGYEICRAVRERELDVPIIMLTAKGQEQDVVCGLELGADDYVTKPFSIAELLARANAFLRRRRAGVLEACAFGDLQLDFASHRLFKGGVEVELTPKEFRLLEFLVRRAGRALTRDDIMQKVWSDVLVTARSVDRCVTTLRAKIEPDPAHPTYIHTIRDVGYRFEPPDGVVPLSAGGKTGDHAATLAPLAPGAQLGRYVIRARIGKGGMAEVHRANDPKLGRDVAIKVLHAHLARNESVVRRFERETRAIAALTHPGIVAIHDVGRDKGQVWAVMELCEGETLRARVDRGPLAWRDAARIAQAIAEALAFAHAKGIVHRDVKAGNVFLTAAGAVKILDFGLAGIVGGEAAREPHAREPETSFGTLIGTPDTMSPEQARGKPADARSDLFSLGCVLYEMLAGRGPFVRATVGETLAAILEHEPPPFTGPRAQRSAELERIVLRCLEKDPERRYDSAAELARELAALVRAGGGVRS